MTRSHFYSFPTSTDKMAADTKSGYHGYLDVKFPSRGRGFPWKTWKRRWVVLQMMKNVSEGRNLAKVSLYLQESSWKDKQKERESLFLDDVTCLKRSKSRKHLYAFEISGDELVHLHLAGKSETETQAWMSAIRAIFWPVPPERLANIKDVQMVSVIDNECSEELSLNGAYLLEGSCSSITLRHLADLTVAHQWLLPSVARFYVPSTKVEDDENKVLTILAAKPGQEDLLPFFFFTADAREVIEDLKLRIQSSTCPRRHMKSNMKCIEDPTGEPSTGGSTGQKLSDRRLSENDLLSGSDSESHRCTRQVSLPSLWGTSASQIDTIYNIDLLDHDYLANGAESLQTIDISSGHESCHSIPNDCQAMTFYGVEQVDYQNGKLKSMSFGSLDKRSQVPTKQAPLHRQITHNSCSWEPVPDVCLSGYSSEYGSEYYSGDSELETKKSYRSRSKTDSDVVLQKKGRLPLIPRSVSESEKVSIAAFLRRPIGCRSTSPDRRISISSGYVADIEKSPIRRRANTCGSRSEDLRRQSNFYLTHLFDPDGGSPSQRQVSRDDNARSYCRRDSLFVPHWDFDIIDDDLRKASTESTRTLVSLSLDDDLRKASSESNKTYMDLDFDQDGCSSLISNPIHETAKELDINGNPPTPPPRPLSKRKVGVAMTGKCLDLLPYIDYSGPIHQAPPSTDSDSFLSGSSCNEKAATDERVKHARESIPTLPLIVLPGMHRPSIDSCLQSSVSGHSTDSSLQAMDSPVLQRRSPTHSSKLSPGTTSCERAPPTNQSIRDISTLDISADYISVTSSENNDREELLPKPRQRRRSRKKSGGSQRGRQDRSSAKGHQGPAYCTTTSRLHRRSLKSGKLKNRAGHTRKDSGQTKEHPQFVTDTSDTDILEYNNLVSSHLNVQSKNISSRKSGPDPFSNTGDGNGMDNGKQHPVESDKSEGDYITPVSSTSGIKCIVTEGYSPHDTDTNGLPIDEVSEDTRPESTAIKKSDRLQVGHHLYPSRSKSCPSSNVGDYLVPVSSSECHRSLSASPTDLHVSPLGHVYMDLDSVVNERMSDITNNKIKGDASKDIDTENSDYVRGRADAMVTESNTGTTIPSIIHESADLELVSQASCEEGAKSALRGKLDLIRQSSEPVCNASNMSDSRRKKDLKKYLGMPSHVENPMLSPPSLPERPKTLPSLDKNKTLRRSVFSSLIGKRPPLLSPQQKTHTRFNARHHSLVPLGCQDDSPDKDKRCSTVSLPPHALDGLDLAFQNIRLQESTDKSDDEVSLISESSSAAPSRHNSLADIHNPLQENKLQDDGLAAVIQERESGKMTPEPFKDLLDPSSLVDMLSSRSNGLFSRQTSIVSTSSCDTEEVCYCGTETECSHSRLNLLDIGSDDEVEIPIETCECQGTIENVTGGAERNVKYAKTTFRSVSLAVAASKAARSGTKHPRTQSESFEHVYMEMGPMKEDKTHGSIDTNSEIQLLKDDEDPRSSIYMLMDSVTPVSTLKRKGKTLDIGHSIPQYQDETYMNMTSLTNATDPDPKDRVPTRDSLSPSTSNRIKLTSPSLEDFSTCVEGEDIYMLMGSVTGAHQLHTDSSSRDHDNLYMNLDSFEKDRPFAPSVGKDDICTVGDNVHPDHPPISRSVIEPPRLRPKSQIAEAKRQLKGIHSAHSTPTVDGGSVSSPTFVKPTPHETFEAGVSIKEDVYTGTMNQDDPLNLSNSSSGDRGNHLDPINRVAPLPQNFDQGAASTMETTGNISIDLAQTQWIEDTYMTLGAMGFPGVHQHSLGLGLEQGTRTGELRVQDNVIQQVDAGIEPQEREDIYISSKPITVSHFRELPSPANVTLDTIGKKGYTGTAYDSSHESPTSRDVSQNMEYLNNSVDSSLGDAPISAIMRSDSEIANTPTRVTSSTHPGYEDLKEDNDAREISVTRIATPRIELSSPTHTPTDALDMCCSDDHSVEVEDPLLKPSKPVAEQAPTSPVLTYEIAETEPWILVQDQLSPNQLPSSDYVESQHKSKKLAAFVINKARASFRGLRKFSVGRSCDDIRDPKRTDVPRKKLSIPHSLNQDFTNKRGVSSHTAKVETVPIEAQIKKWNKPEASPRLIKSTLFQRRSFSSADNLRRASNDSDDSFRRDRPRSDTIMSEIVRGSSPLYQSGSSKLERQGGTSPNQRRYQSVFQRRRRFAQRSSPGSADDLNSSRDSDEDFYKKSPSHIRRAPEMTDSCASTTLSESVYDSDVSRTIAGKTTSYDSSLAQSSTVSKSLTNSTIATPPSFRRRFGCVQYPFVDSPSGYSSAPDDRSHSHAETTEIPISKPWIFTTSEDNYISISQLKREGLKSLQPLKQLDDDPATKSVSHFTSASVDTPHSSREFVHNVKELNRAFSESNLRRLRGEPIANHAASQTDKVSEMKYLSVSELGSMESVRERLPSQHRVSISYSYTANIREQHPQVTESFQVVNHAGGSLCEKIASPSLMIFTNTIPVLTYTHLERGPNRHDAHSDSSFSSHSKGPLKEKANLPNTESYSSTGGSPSSYRRRLVDSEVVQSTMDKCQAWVDTHRSQMPELANQLGAAASSRTSRHGDESDTEISDIFARDGVVTWKETIFVKNFDVFKPVSSCYSNV